MTDTERLLAGTAKWNAWRRERPDHLPNLTGADLTGADLAGADLRRANLAGADLRRAYLVRADLAGARLNWNSHDLVGEVLWQAATSDVQRRLAAFAGRAIGLCWQDWRERSDPGICWARSVLRKLQGCPL